MRKFLTLTTLFILGVSVAFATAPKEPKEKKEKAPKEKKEKATDQSKEDKKKAKEEENRIKDELKAYMKNPLSYKARIDNYKSTIDSDETQVSRMKNDLDNATAKATDLESKLASEDEDIKKLQEENTTLKANPVKETAGDEKSATSTAGTTFKVQLGMYRGFSINKYFDQPRSLGYESVEGMNRYVIGSFPDEQTAKNFVNDMRKLGLRDAFVSKYIDGTRVYEWSENPKYKGKKVPTSLADALQNDGPKKKGAKEDN